MQISKCLLCTDFSRHTAALIRHCRHLLSARPDTTLVLQGFFTLPPVDCIKPAFRVMFCCQSLSFLQDTFSNTSMDLHHTVPGHIPGGYSCPLCVLFAVGIFVDSMILPLFIIITEKKLRTFLLSATFLFYKFFFY